MAKVGWIGTSLGGCCPGLPDPQKLVGIGLKPRVKLSKFSMVVITAMVIYTALFQIQMVVLGLAVLLASIYPANLGHLNL